MRIGILTFHHGTNYGGILQCYALQKVLREYGHDVEVIDYVPPILPLYKRILNKIKTINSFHVFCKVARLHIMPGKPQDKKAAGNAALLKSQFDEFRHKYLNISPRLNIDTIGEYANEHYDAIIVGSDQVWTGLYDDDSAYFIGWSPEFKGQRISYAACSAHEFVQESRRKVLENLLSKFKIISVRDTTTATLVENITGTRPAIVPDPTMLHDFKEFLPAETEHEEYILTYILGPEISGGHTRALDKIKEQTGDIPVYSIVSKTTDIVSCSDKVTYTASPEEWIRLLAGAKAVYTDSFHAILFSMKFGVPFAAYWVDPVRSSRLIFLRETYGLSNIVYSADKVAVEPHIQHDIEDIVLSNI